ncbi:MAG TPA: nucleoside triphosphate pyrophosphohydrolase [Anaerolineaceae bacterium]|nr:nucleoside triphosphate pyrophosphohydrolase [Anaerolineaceae bacterium]
MNRSIFNGITILGLGPGNPDLLTRQAWDWLNQIPEVYLRTRQHPTIAGFPSNLEIHSFDEYYQNSEAFETVYRKIVEKILELGRRPEGVTYAVPGHPYVAEATGPEIVKRAKEQDIPVKVIEGISFLELTCSALELDPFPYLSLVDALELGSLHHPLFPPSLPVLVAQIYSKETASEVKLTLMTEYPDEHPVRMVHAAGTAEQVVENVALYEIDRSPHLGLLTALYVPPLGDDTSLEAFQEVVAALRAPDGCPWDREQTHLSLRTSLLQETYETLAAMDAEDARGMQEEFGDLLMQIVLNAQIASEDGEFNMADVVQGINRKIVRRHPHVFGEAKVKGVQGVLQNWEKLKAAERKENGQAEVRGILDGVPTVFPSLAQAQEYQERAARVGFDWAEVKPVIAKVVEELEEVQTAETPEQQAAELGDLLFSTVNLARWYKVDAEAALRETNQRFRKRFAYIEKRARESGRNLSEMTLAEMDVFWDEAKRME